MALPGRVHLSAGRPVRSHRLRLRQSSRRAHDRRAPAARLDRGLVRPAEPEARRQLGDRAQREPVRVLPRGVPGARRRASSSARARRRTPWTSSRCEPGAGRRGVRTALGGRGDRRGHRVQHAAARRHPHLLRPGQRTAAHPERGRHQPSRRRAGARRRGRARACGSTRRCPMPSTRTSSGSRGRRWTTAATRWSWRRACSATAA